MKCLILANKVNKELFPLTKEVPAGLLPLKGKPVVEWMIEDLETIGDIEYLMVSCNAYDRKIKDWKQRKSYGEKISVRMVSEEACEEEILKMLEGELGKETLLVLPSDYMFEFSLAELVKEFRESEKPLRFVHGNEQSYEELPVHFYNGDEMEQRAQWNRIFVEDFCYLIDSLPKYEDLEAGRVGARVHDKFEIQAYTQERYGDIYISRITMDKRVLCKRKVQAELVIANRGQKVLNSSNSRLTYSLWLEEPRVDSYVVDRIPIETDEIFPLPCTLEPGEEKIVKTDVTVPYVCGKFYLRFDIEIEGQRMAQDAHYLCFPTVTVTAEPAADRTREELMSQAKIIFVGMPESANGGEHLEAKAIKEFVCSILPDRLCLEYPARNVEEYWRICGRISNPDDLVFVYGSGYMGTPEKMAEENFRRRTASSVAMPKIRLQMYVLPLHQGFDRMEDGREQIEHSATAYGGNNYYLYGASEADYQFFLKHFEKTNVGKAPLLMYGLESVEDREPAGDDFTVVVCGGSAEGFLDTTFRAIDENQLRRMYLNLDYNAYQPGAFFGQNGREYLMNFCEETILDTKAVVTDSYYGLAYALHCNRPCVVYGNSQDKEWFADRDDVIFVEKLEEIEAACKEILNRKGKGPLKAEHYLPLKRQISLQE